ncbi:MAG: hypothetical protein KGJ57_19345 [Sphingomonadales bacterium]|nr:hypothetical protein [Sphingomonadales bacterium]MDE2171551.1 hypothetical protein [Sphingomonadales bacterium]
MLFFALLSSLAMYRVVWRIAEASLFDRPGTRLVTRWYPVRTGPKACQLLIEPGPSEIVWQADCADVSRVAAGQAAAGGRPFGPSSLCQRVPVQIAGDAVRVMVADLHRVRGAGAIRSCS